MGEALFKSQEFLSDKNGVGNLRIEDADFLWFQQVVKEIAGITLGGSKRELVQSRLRPRLVQLGLTTYQAYRKHLEQQDENAAEWQILVNLITTNKTDFFREPDHFQWLVERFLPEWKKQNRPILRVWSAASSTGEEAYTLAMILAHHLGSTHGFEILGTDIDTKVLEAARNGVYPRTRLDTVPLEYHSSFLFGTGEIKGWMKVKPAVKSHATFQRLNLISLPFPWKEHFDLIFCRNVFIYFSTEVIEEVVEGLRSACNSGGILFIGQSESLQNVRHGWKYVKPSIFRKG